MIAASGAGGRQRFRRVVLAMDTASGDPRALDRAAVLAARLRGDLLALFVDDIDLVRLARHQGVLAYSTLSAGGRELGADHLQTCLRLQAQRLCRAMEQAAARRQVKAVFEMRQGRLLAEVLQAAGDDDLAVISWPVGKAGAPWTGSPPPPEAVVRALAEARVRSVLLLHPQSGDGPVLVAFDGSEAAWHGLATAAQVADVDGGRIEVALLAERVALADGWAREIGARLADSELSATFLLTPRADVRLLCALATHRRCTLLVLGADRTLGEGEVARSLLYRAACSVLLVR